MMVILGVLLAGCDESATGSAEGLDDGSGPRIDSSTFALDARAPDKQKLRRLFSNASREEVSDGIAHYQFEVAVGPGKYDVVRLHRIVREHRPHRPVRTDGGVFMVHGAAQDFGDIYLSAGTETPTPGTSAPLYLAANGVDVWGVDLAWTLVPEETTDLSFMKDWGLERDADHLLAAMSIARLLRGITRQGFGRLHLMGFSYSVGLAYIAAAQETQQHWLRRDIGGLIPVEGGLVVENKSRRRDACERADEGRKQIAEQNYHRTTTGSRTVHQLAVSAPNDLSPLPPFEGFTNYEAALLVSVTPPFWHFVGVEFSEAGIPVDLLYSDADRWIKLLGGVPPNTAYMPRLPGVETSEIRCGEKDLRLDDHLSEIAVPILYVGAGGGLGEEAGRWTTAVTASDDVTIYEVSLQPEGQRSIDFGHADLWIADDADDLVWETLHGWLIDHNARIPRTRLMSDGIPGPKTEHSSRH